VIAEKEILTLLLKTSKHSVVTAEQFSKVAIGKRLQFPSFKRGIYQTRKSELKLFENIFKFIRSIIHLLKKVAGLPN